MSNKGDLVHWRGDNCFYRWWETWWEHYAVPFWSRLFSVILGFFWLLKSSFVTFREEVLKTLLLMSICCDCKESTIFSVLLGFSFLLKSHLYYSREEVLQTFVHTAEIDLQSPEPFVPFLKPLIGSVPIGEGPRDVAQWRGWTPLSTSVCVSVLCFLLGHLFISLVFSFLFWAFNFC